MAKRDSNLVSIDLLKEKRILREGVPHSFEKTTFSSLTYCNLCRDFMWGLTNEGVECTQCGFSAHSTCIEGVPPLTTCCLASIPAFSGLTTIEEENRVLESLRIESVEEVFESHHWVEGNCHMGKNCFLCDAPITSLGSESFRCSRCKLQAHTKCLLESQETICSPLHARLLVRKRALYTEDSTPLLVFVNSRSGGQQGIYLIKKFKRLLNPNQVVDLDIEGPIPALNLFQHHPNLRILCCGGDGTIGWVLSSLDKFPNIQPEVAVLPLGTGNDLARTLHWGGGYSEEKLSPILSKIERAIPVPLDRWVISTSVNKDGVEQEARHVMNNYFSIGVDAEVALAFHKLRMEAPALCSSRLGNKFWYLMNGIKTMIGKIPLIDQFIQVEVDGKNCWLDENIGAIIILNLPSYMGGADLWGPYNESEEFHRPSYNDRILELVAVTGSFHLVNVSINLASAIRLAQGSSIKIKFIQKQSLSVQVDGEPWLQPPCEITIEHLNQVQMLQSAKDSEDEEDLHYLDFEGTLF